MPGTAIGAKASESRSEDVQRFVPIALAAVIVAWLTTITIFIAREPATGGSTPDQLGQGIAGAAQSNKVDDLEHLVRLPEDEKDASTALISQIRAACGTVGAVAVQATDGDRGTLLISSSDGRPCGTLAIAKVDGRWVIDIGAALRTP
jgi:hypothetical protein